MRIITGSRKGRRFDAPRDSTTRPTSDFVREAAFNLIGPVDGAGVLDLFAGSGALGLEALSRGAGRMRVRRFRPRSLPHDQREPRQAGASRRPCSARTRSARSAASTRRTTWCSATRRTTFDRARPARAAARTHPRPGRAARLRDRRADEPEIGGSQRRGHPASTAPHALRCSSDDHRNLPRLVRPRHNGHVDVIARAAQIFDRVVVGVVGNPQHKQPLFSIEERVDLVREALADVDERRGRRLQASSSSTSRAAGRRT